MSVIERSGNSGGAELSFKGAPFRVSRIADLGWLFELGADEKIPRLRRQPELAPGYDFARVATEVEEDADLLTLVDGGARLVLSRSTGAFSLLEGDSLYFKSVDEPLTFAAEPVLEYEGVHSTYFGKLLATNPPTWATQRGRFESIKMKLEFERPVLGPILGLPGSTGEFDRAGYRFELYNTDTSNHIPGRDALYQSWPILFFRGHDSAGWCGIFWDNPSRTFVDCGDYVAGRISFESCWGNARFVIVTGESLVAVSNRIQRFIGAALFPPAWAFGYHQSRWSYMSSFEARSVVKEFRGHGIPLDALYFDIDYMDGFRCFTTNPSTFPDLPACVEELANAGVTSVAIVDPGIKEDEGYDVYKELVESHKILRRSGGEPLIARAWPGACVLPDFSDEETRTFWSDRQRAWLEKTGIRAVWNDMNEPSNWDGGNSVVGASESVSGRWDALFNLYAYYMIMASKDGIPERVPGERPFVITRAGYPGIHRNAIIWHGDNHSWWEHLRLAIDTAVQYSICGAHFTGPDVPGFAQNAPDDLAVRFFQLGAFLPFFRGHSSIFTEHKEPFRFQGETRRLITAAIELRYSLIREWYSGMERCIREGFPALQPIIRDNGAVVRDEFVLFDKFAVAPVVERGEQDHQIYLPPGMWYRLGEPNSTPVEGGKTFLLPVTLDTIPVFVRAGSVVVRNTPRRNVADTMAEPEGFEVYPAADGAAVGYWYDDRDNRPKRRVIEARAGADPVLRDL